MVDLSTASDQEQADALKAWWKENGLSIALGLIIGVGGMYGWRYWQSYQVDQNAQASQQFETIMADKQLTDASKFIQNNNKSIYAVNLAFKQASDFIEDEKYEQAEEQYRWIMNNADNLAHKTLARINLAKTFLANNQAQEAINFLNEEAEYSHFIGQKNLILGDAFSKQNQTEKAKEAYLLAKISLANQADLVELIQLKINQLN